MRAGKTPAARSSSLPPSLSLSLALSLSPPPSPSRFPFFPANSVAPLCTKLLPEAIHPPPATPKRSPTTGFTTSVPTSLHWNYSADNSSLSIAFVATPTASIGWVSWGINPFAKAMIGSQALLAYRLSNGFVAVDTYNIFGYENIVPSPHRLQRHPQGSRVLWRRHHHLRHPLTPHRHRHRHHRQSRLASGPRMTGTSPKVHAMEPENKNATSSLDFLKVESGGSGGNRNTTSPVSSPSVVDVAARFSSPFCLIEVAGCGEDVVWLGNFGRPDGRKKTLLMLGTLTMT